MAREEHTIVRPATPADDAAIAAIALEAHAVHADALPHVFQPVSPSVMTPTDVAALRDAADRIVLVAERDGAVLGYAHAEVQHAPANAFKRASATLHVHAMATAERARRTGVGSALLRAVREEATRRGLDGVSLEVYAFNERARAFYEREGYAVQRERRVYVLRGR